MINCQSSTSDSIVADSDTCSCTCVPLHLAQRMGLELCCESYTCFCHGRVVILMFLSSLSSPFLFGFVARLPYCDDVKQLAPARHSITCTSAGRDARVRAEVHAAVQVQCKWMSVYSCTLIYSSLYLHRYCICISEIWYTIQCSACRR